MTGTGGSGPLAALLGRSLAADNDAGRERAGAGTRTGSRAPAAGARRSSPPAGTVLRRRSRCPNRRRNRRPNRRPKKNRRPTPAERRRPKPGRIKHVFVDLAGQPRLRTAAFGAHVADALPVGDPAAAGRAAEQLLAARRRRAAERDRRDQRPAAERRDQADCPTYEEFPPRQGDARASSPARLRLPGRNADPRRPARRGQLTWRAYMEGMVDETGKPDNCVHPEPGDGRGRRSAGGYAAELRTRSSTSTRCSTSATARPTTCRSTELEQGPEEGRDDAELLATSRPTSATPASAGQCPAGRPTGPPRPTPSSPTWVPKILASPAYKADGLLIVTFGRGQPAAPSTRRRRRRPPTRCKVGALLVSPLRHPGRHRRRPLRPLLAAALDRGPLRPLAPRRTPAAPR